MHINLPPQKNTRRCPQHFDSDATLDGRRVTAIIYLNDGWQPGCGGELRLYPFPAPPVDVEPLADRMCLFASTNMLHRCGWLRLFMFLTRGGLDLRTNLDCCAGAASPAGSCPATKPAAASLSGYPKGTMRDSP